MEHIYSAHLVVLTALPSRCHTGEGVKMESSTSSLFGLGLQLNTEEMMGRYQATSGNIMIFKISGRDLMLTRGACFVCVNEYGLDSWARIRGPADAYTTHYLSPFLVSFYCQTVPFEKQVHQYPFASPQSRSTSRLYSSQCVTRVGYIYLQVPTDLYPTIHYLLPLC